MKSNPGGALEGLFMKRLAVLVLFLAGCSTAPVADLLDYFTPGKLEPGKVAPYGGVCGPQQVGAPGPSAVIPPQPLIAGPPLATAPAQPQLGTPTLPGTPLPQPDFGLPPGR
jgi:hypothetical protein